jgi:hypothetical protein
MATNPEATALKARRADERQNRKPDPDAEPIPPAADRPVMVGEDIARRFPLLGDPREPRAVAESSGALFGIEPGEGIGGYVVAEEDAFDVITPPGCKTAVARLRWAKGHHVPREVYAEWEKAQATKGD